MTEVQSQVSVLEMNWVLEQVFKSELSRVQAQVSVLVTGEFGTLTGKFLSQS